MKKTFLPAFCAGLCLYCWNLQVFASADGSSAKIELLKGFGKFVVYFLLIIAVLYFVTLLTGKIGKKWGKFPVQGKPDGEEDSTAEAEADREEPTLTAFGAKDAAAEEEKTSGE